MHTSDQPRPSSREAVVVIGGGFTGCMTALRLVQAGHQVTLYETQPHLGGTLRDYEEPGFGRRFLKGCQYADVDAPWHAATEGLVREHLDRVPHTMGSVTRQGGDIHVAHDVAVPVLGGALPARAQHANTVLADAATTSLAEHFATYDAWAPWLTQYAERSGHAAGTLSAYAALGMQLSRVVAADIPSAEVLACKSRSAWADAYLAVPRRARSGSALQALVPRSGWTAFFDALRVLLVQQGVVVHTGVPLRVKGANGHIAIEAPALPSSAVYVWAGSPVPLHKAFGDAFPGAGIARLDNTAVSAVHVHADVTGWEGPVPHYVQWFDTNSPLFRLYVYRMSDRVQACFECKGPLTMDVARTVLADVAQQCTSMGLADPNGLLRFTSVSLAPLRLHHLQTVRDVEQLSRLAQQLAAWQPDSTSPIRAMIDGAWLAYGREQKLREIKDALMQRGLVLAW